MLQQKSHTISTSKIKKKKRLLTKMNYTKGIIVKHTLIVMHNSSDLLLHLQIFTHTLIAMYLQPLAQNSKLFTFIYPCKQIKYIFHNGIKMNVHCIAITGKNYN